MLITRIVPIALILASIIFAMASEVDVFIDLMSVAIVLVPRDCIRPKWYRQLEL